RGDLVPTRATVVGVRLQVGALARAAIWVRRRAQGPTRTTVLRVGGGIRAKGRRTRGRTARGPRRTAGEGGRGGAGAAQRSLRVLSEKPLAAVSAALTHFFRFLGTVLAIRPARFADRAVTLVFVPLVVVILVIIGPCPAGESCQEPTGQ